MSATSDYLERLLDECGGFSRFQTLLLISMVGSKLGVTWSTMMMTFAGATPDWYCLHDIKNDTSGVKFNYTTFSLMNQTRRSLRQCYSPEASISHSCADIEFDENMETVVSEWSLVCDKEWVTSTIISIQMVGILISALASGHLADMIGRKPTHFLSLVILIIFNVASVFSTCWEMFAVFRFFIGIGIGCHLTIHYNFLIEFTPAKQRSLITAFPTWSCWAVLFGLVSMWLHNWKYLHIATAACTLPWLLFWWVTPESYRYLVVHNKIEKAEQVIRCIAKRNGCPVPNLQRMRHFVLEEDDINAKKKYSLRDLVSTPYLLKISVLIAICWMSCGYGYYAISFGVQSLSGNLYLNLCLLSVVEIPATISTFYLNNRFGRKPMVFASFLFAGISGTVVASLQITDLEAKSQLVNGFALASKMSIFVGWIALALITTESYPTAVRNIGYGLQSSLSRVGAMIAPQIVYLNNHVPGIMYFIFGGVMLLSTISTAFLQETNNKPITDVIGKGKETRNVISDTDM